MHQLIYKWELFCLLWLAAWVPKHVVISLPLRLVWNLFWIVVAASGAGKSQSRKRFISEPLEYILSNGRVKIGDFEISKFTRAGESIIICNIYTVCNYLNTLNQMSIKYYFLKELRKNLLQLKIMVLS